MRTLRGRIGLALLTFALITLLALGGSLWLALRDLHRDAAIGSLTELTERIEEAFRTHFEAAAAALAEVWPRHSKDGPPDPTEPDELPAIAIYLEAGFRPYVGSEQDRIAWREAASAMRRPEHTGTILECVETSP